jgi:D-alanyl-D-alanine carboxypeptidase (penicillin-binding protein 5/6)
VIFLFWEIWILGNSKDTKNSVNNTLDHSDNVDDEDYGLEIIEFERQDTGAAHSQPRGSVRRAHREHERSSSGNARMKNSISQMQLEREKAAHRKRIKKFIPFALAAVLGTAALVTGLHLHMKKRTVTDKTAPADASVSSEASEELAALEQAGSDTSAEQAAISDSTVSAETSAVEDSSSAASVSSRASSAFNGMETDRTGSFDDNIISSYGIILDADTMEILGKRSPYTKMYPASMTKVMTLLVAVDNISEEQLDDTFEITREITDYTYSHECSAVGFDVGEKVKVRDLLYGLILPSGGDAALALAQYVAGSQEDFVRMMNEKLAELNL